MDQVKTFLRQCIKYRFWIAVGVSVLLPMIGYFLGSGAYVQATTKREGEIKAADTDVGKYTAPNQNVPEVTRIVTERKEVLAKDVDSTQRKLYELQEPLLKWPEVVEAKFRSWGRKWPENVDRGQVQATIYDYTVAYPEFVTKVYQTFKPWNPEDGTGIVLAPDEVGLLKPAKFSQTAPPELGKIWAEQERLWVVTALLDVVAKVNNDAGAKDWDGAWIKEIVDIDVGSPAAQDQKSLAKGVALDTAPPLVPEGTPPPDPAAAPGGGMMGGGMMGGGMGSAPAGEIYYLKAEGSQPFKILPVEITVKLDQNRLSEFLVALENSPMAIQVMEPEISKPTTPVIKPILNETGYAAGGMFGQGGRSGMPMGGPDDGGMGAMAGRMQSGRGNAMGGGRPSGGPEGGGMMGMGGGMRGSAPPKKAAVDLRSGVNKNAERKENAKKAASKTTVVKKSVDQYFNVIQVTVYGQARFYNTPAPVPPAEPSTATEASPAATATDPAAPAPTTTPAPGAEPAAPTTPATPPAGEPAVPAPSPVPAPDPGGATPAAPSTTPPPVEADPTPRPADPKS